MKELINSKIVVAIGAGGVGKTTVASALGLYFAKRGQKTLVITVDPARRLLDAMAVTTASDEPCRVSFEGLTEELYVFMPNLRKEWDDFLSAVIGADDLREKIASNHFYRYMAEGMPGALEIICSHVLFRLMQQNNYDKIILDTPPSSHSISFFDVPRKITRVLQQGVFRSLMNRRHSVLFKVTKKLAFLSGGLIEKTFERLIGSHFLSELIEFALTIDSLYEPLLDRVRAMDNLLKDSNTKFALIVKPTRASVVDSAYVKRALHERGIAIHQIILNQIMPKLDLVALKEEQRAMNTSAKPALERLLTMYECEQMLESKLMEQINASFSQVEKRYLYMTEATMTRGELLAHLVADLENEGCE